MKMNIKPPYTVALVTGGYAPESKEDLLLIQAVDALMRDVRIHELTVLPDLAERNALLEQHVNAASKYYSEFSKADMAAMALVEMLLSSGGDGDED